MCENSIPFKGWIIFHHRYIPHFAYPLICGHLGSSTFWLLYLHASRNVGVQISVRDPAFSSFGYTPRGGISGSHGNFMLNFFSNWHADFHSSCTILGSPQQYSRVLVSSLSCQHVLFSVGLIAAVLMGMKCRQAGFMWLLFYSNIVPLIIHW